MPYKAGHFKSRLPRLPREDEALPDVNAAVPAPILLIIEDKQIYCSLSPSTAQQPVRTESELWHNTVGSEAGRHEAGRSSGIGADDGDCGAGRRGAACRRGGRSG